MHEVQLHGDHAEGFQMLFHTLEFFGLCRSCQQCQPAQPQR
jgi:Fur family ferric uptake transcriptional regulator